MYYMNTSRLVHLIESVVDKFMRNTCYINTDSYTDQDIIYYENAVFHLISNLGDMMIEDELLVLTVFWIVIKYELDTFCVTAMDIINFTNSNIHPQDLCELELIILFKLRWSVCKMIEASWNINLLCRQHYSMRDIKENFIFEFR